ncbi:peptide chain release factor N(5)-glutamine methyltransferase [Mucilaginibacter sp. HMF5004]|uniref:peptide chain release factor N(5)-glutamine methyltransferase n=1 Tax=Mucilaginibacter rivuli TaxID=2857527 RepID=UPI001C6051C3|nr:peptide chain release factor N(5)-glutamine methyltransferase [Mucilaginibacter rivuli]MBW4891645.1 peptide chain release factor N(5)-glutamine methyltransferase [Mucilaginibacter rivuli]
MIISDALQLFTESLSAVYDKDEIDSIKYLVLSDILQTSKAKLHAFPDEKLDEATVQKFQQIIQKLQTGEPVQYILGHTEFYGLPFKVNPSVLIPRPETEELVEWVLSESQKLKVKSQKFDSILDIGTGSGCIPIALKKHLPQTQVTSVDISAIALQTAKQNAELNEVEVQFIEADILNPTHNPQLATRNSIIISNPPYVTEHEQLEMHTNVLNHEPHNALFVPDNDPLIFYRVIADFALQHLEPNGLLFFEINENLGKETIELLAGKGFKNIELRQDMRGKDRMIKANL